MYQGKFARDNDRRAKPAAPKAEAELPQPEQLNADAAPTKEKIHRRKPYYHNRRRKPKPDGGHATE